MYLLSSNIGELGLMGVATLAGLPLPLTAVQILYVNLATDGLPALALAVDPPEADLMRRKRNASYIAAPRLRALMIATAAVQLVGSAAEWPQFRGPSRDGRSTEQGLLAKWPESGPRLLWSVHGVGKGGSVIFADGLLYLYAEDGTVGLVRPSTETCEVVSSFKVTQGDGPHWAHLVVAAGKLYIRHGTALMCYDLKAQ